MLIVIEIRLPSPFNRGIAIRVLHLRSLTNLDSISRGLEQKGGFIRTVFFGEGFLQNFGIRGAEHHKIATLTQPSPTSFPVIQ